MKTFAQYFPNLSPIWFRVRFMNLKYWIKLWCIDTLLSALYYHLLKSNTFRSYRRNIKKTRSGLLSKLSSSSYSHWPLCPHVIYHDTVHLIVGACMQLCLSYHITFMDFTIDLLAFLFLFFKPTSSSKLQMIRGLTWVKWGHYCIFIANLIKKKTNDLRLVLTCDLKSNFLHFWQISVAEGYSWSMCGEAFIRHYVALSWQGTCLSCWDNNYTYAIRFWGD